MEKRDKYLSKLERLRFDVLANSTTVKEAAFKLGIAPATLYNWTCKLRKKLYRERGHLNAVLAQQKRTSLLKEALSVRRPVISEDDEWNKDKDEEGY